MISRAALVRWVDALLHLQGDPARLAASFALGVGVGFSPFVGLHIGLAMAIATWLRLNRVAVFAGLWVNLPWIMVPWYVGVTVLAARVLDLDVPPGLHATFSGLVEQSPFTLLFWQELGRIASEWLVPFVVGSSVGALVLGLLTYPTALLAIRRVRRREGR
jgi:uncharacterized protein (DUF2062 family)